MSLRLVRIDDRLIHGQVVAVWLRALGAQRIVIVDDATARDEFLREVLTLAAPPGVPGRGARPGRAAPSAASSWPPRRSRSSSWPARLGRCWRCARPASRSRSWTWAAWAPGRAGERLHKTISVSPDELRELRELEQLGTRVEIQIVADDRPIPFRSLDSGRLSRRARRDRQVQGRRDDGQEVARRRSLLLAVVAGDAGAAVAFGASGAGAAAGRRGTITVSAWQAALIALGYYLANSPWLFGLAFFTLYRPLVAGFFVGLHPGRSGPGHAHRRGDQRARTWASSPPAAICRSTPAFAGWVGTTIALAGHLDRHASAIARSPFRLGLLGTIIFYGRMAVDSIFAHWADARAEKARHPRRGPHERGARPDLPLRHQLRAGLPPRPQRARGTSRTPSIGCRSGSVNGLVIAGGILPAIGIALNMRFIFRGAAIPYFFIGFILWTATRRLGRRWSSIAAIGLALAYLHLDFVRPARRPTPEPEPDAQPSRSPARSAAPRPARPPVRASGSPAATCFDRGPCGPSSPTPTTTTSGSRAPASPTP